MNIIDLFKRKKEKESLDISKKENELLNIPKVVFEDTELQITVGQWLDILPSRQGFGNSGVTFYMHLGAEELMKKLNISPKEMKEIETEFGFLLKLVGIEETEVCTLNQFDRDNFSFHCHFNSGSDATISLRWGSFMDSPPKFIINYQNESKIYSYWKDSTKKIELTLESYSTKNEKNGTSCFRYLSPYTAYFTIQNKEYTFSVEIGNPTPSKTYSNKAFKLKNEEELREYLLDLSFPFEINEVYKKICEISIDSVHKYPRFKLEVEKKLDEKNKKTTDKLSLAYGQLERFIIVRNGKTISIDSNGNWSYDSEKLTLSQKEGEINYHFTIPSKELSTIASPLEQYSAVCEEINKIKILTKNILKNDKE